MYLPIKPVPPETRMVAIQNEVKRQRKDKNSLNQKIKE
ncbi:Hypothetical protein Minf_2474 [Methylacidiphilum infernorum V4]|uniref:Uncharacterized protein n=1 Tax=Methylacidiphilum infernorum (isolate V4) TaxID=481448 RepID=B3E1F1_METI4|nr:Hypothetical protein Minf_2474 [Methylacidiphilum infernorum V4]